MNEESTPNPPMSQKEASWHELRAGQRAGAAARAQGEDPAIVGAVVDATLPRLNVAGHQIKPATKGTIMAITRLAPHLLSYAQENGLEPSLDAASPSELDTLEMALMILIFSDPLTVYKSTEHGLPPAILAECERLIFQIPIAEMMELQEALETELEAIGMVAAVPQDDTAATPGKPSAPSQSSENPPQQPGAVSPPSSGSCPNMTSPSTPLSGSSLSSPPTPSSQPAMSVMADPVDPALPSTPSSRPGVSAAASLVPTTPSSPASTHGDSPETP